ncbi:MAG: transposase [Lachnospiraceae bacterium]|nr:transposase [Lachnospiraceae bacterium]
MKRTTTQSYVLTLKLNTSRHDEVVLEKRFLYGQRIYNTIVRHCIRQIRKLQNDKQYKELLSVYLKDRKHNVKDTHLTKALKDTVSSYGLTEYSLHAFVKEQQHRYAKDIDSLTAQKIATAVWKAAEKNLYGNGKYIHFKKQDDMLSLEGKNNNTGIRYKDGRFLWNGLSISVQHDKRDTYAQESLQNRIKYCRIKRIPLGTRYHYYLELILEGLPPTMHTVGTGRTGIDIGTSTVAVVSDDGYCRLDELAKEAGSIERKKRVMLRKLDRSRRAMNPNNYNPDGTVKKGRLKWEQSHTYRKLYMKYKSLCRKRAAIVKQSHETLANEILQHGATVRVERMSFTGLAKRTKEAKRKPDGKYGSRKRFGTSIQTRAPAMFLGIMERKLGYAGTNLIYIDTVTFRASQYNHAEDIYKKKNLSERYHFIDGYKIQRDLYSAFLIMNSNDANDSTDRPRCLETFDSFRMTHDACIRELINSNHKYPSSMGLKYFVTC